jgi:hypothetical protein
MLMTLQLSDSNRQTNYYVQQLDKKLENNAINTTFVTPQLMTPKLENPVINSKHLKTVDPSDYNILKTFNDDVVIFYDFSDKDNVGLDMAGNGRNAVNVNKVSSVYDNVRGQCAHFPIRRLGQFNTPSTASSFLNMTDHFQAFKSPNYTFSIWFKPLSDNSGTTQTLLCIGSSTNQEDYMRLSFRQARIRLDYNRSNTVPKEVSYLGVNNLVIGTWYHVVLTNSKTGGHKIYVNNTLRNAPPTGGAFYTVNEGSAVVDLDVMPSVFDTVSIGASVYPTDVTLGFNLNSGLVANHPFFGTISDAMFLNRAITATEVDRLYNNNIGYTVMAIAGQSNAVGWSIPIADGIDNDFSEINQKVYQYDTKNNISSDGTAINSSNIISITETMLAHPVVATGSDRLKVGMWRTFMTDLVSFGRLPARKKILLVPLANGGTGFSTGEWIPTGKQALTCVNALNDVLNPSNNSNNMWNKLNCFFWYQGEADIPLLNLNYKTNFLTTWNFYKTNIYSFAQQDFSKVFAEISADSQAIYFSDGYNVQKKVNKELQELANELSKGKFILTRNLTHDPADGVHVDPQAQRDLGHLVFDALCETQSLRNDKPACNLNVGDKVVTASVPLRCNPVQHQINQNRVISRHELNDSFIIDVSNGNVTVSLPFLFAGEASGSRTKFKIINLGEIDYTCTLNCTGVGKFSDNTRVPSDTIVLNPWSRCELMVNKSGIYTRVENPLFTPVSATGKINLSLDYHFSYTKTYTCTGAYMGTIPIKYVRFGKMVFVTVPPTTNLTMVATADINMSGQSDSLLLPTDNQAHVCGYRDLSTSSDQSCTWYFRSTGTIEIKNGVSLTATFADTKIIAFHGFSTCYIAQ